LVTDPEVAVVRARQQITGIRRLFFRHEDFDLAEAIDRNPMRGPQRLAADARLDPVRIEKRPHLGFGKLPCTVDTTM
jgi:hypothetical protein